MRLRGNPGRHKERKRASHTLTRERWKLTERRSQKRKWKESVCRTCHGQGHPEILQGTHEEQEQSLIEPASWEKVQWYLESAARLQGEEMIGLRDKLMRGGACVVRCLEKWFCIHEMVANTIWTCYHNGCQSDSACGSVAVLTEAINLKTIQKAKLELWFPSYNLTKGTLCFTSSWLGEN